MSEYDEAQFSHKFFFVHESGIRLYPVRMKNRDTGRVAFRVFDSDHTKKGTLEVDEDEMVRKVFDEGYAVRMSSIDRNRHGGYRADGRSIIEVVKLFS